MHAIEGPSSSIITSDTSIYTSIYIDIVGAIHCRRIIFWCIHFHLPDSVTKYSIEWDVYFDYYLEAESIFCRVGTKFYTMAVKAQVLIEVPVELVELPT